MSKWNKAISVTFNDNDGKIGWQYNPESSYDIARHQRIFGKWRVRWICFKYFWKAMRAIEQHAKERHKQTTKLWIYRAEIPE